MCGAWCIFSLLQRIAGKYIPLISGCINAVLPHNIEITLWPQITVTSHQKPSIEMFVWSVSDLHGCSAVCNGDVWSLLQCSDAAALPGPLQVVAEFWNVQRQSETLHLHTVYSLYGSLTSCQSLLTFYYFCFFFHCLTSLVFLINSRL